MLVADVDLENWMIRITQGKSNTDRYVLFGKSFATALRTHIAARWLFQSRCNGRFSTRRIQQIVKEYAKQAGMNATSHSFQHQCSTRHSGFADAELQLITDHARRETLTVYQHVALDGDLEERYWEAMKKVDFDNQPPRNRLRTNEESPDLFFVLSHCVCLASAMPGGHAGAVARCPSGW